MCSINGIYFDHTVQNEEKEKWDLLKLVLMTTISNSSERGKDSFGLLVFYRDNRIPNLYTFPNDFREISRYEYNIDTGEPDWARGFSRSELSPIVKTIMSLNLQDVRCIITQCRAEPTTEFKKEKNPMNIPPENYGTTWVSHNGTIANDKELLNELGRRDLIDENWIDSKIIPFMVEHELNNRFDLEKSARNQKDSREIIKSALRKIEGSMAIGMWSDRLQTMTLYRNYRELHLRHYRGAYIWSSKKEYFCEGFREISSEIEIPPYSGIFLQPQSITNQREHTKFKLPEQRPNDDKAYVICSSGLDSTTVAKIACLDPDLKEVNLVHCKYGCKAEKREIKQFRKIGRRLQKEHPEKRITYGFVDMNFLHRIGGSSLTDDSQKVNTEGNGEAGAEYAHEWVPFRNGAMISIVAAMCDAHNVGRIYLGLNLEEAGAYPDNTTEFFEKFNEVLDCGSKSRPVIHNPLATLVKHEIVAKAIEIGAPIDLSWSCYHGGKYHCGKCGPCFMRKMAFKMNGQTDMMKYDFGG